MGRAEEVLYAMEQEVRWCHGWQRMHPPCCKPFCLLCPHITSRWTHQNMSLCSHTHQVKSLIADIHTSLAARRVNEPLLLSQAQQLLELCQEGEWQLGLDDQHTHTTTHQLQLREAQTGECDSPGPLGRVQQAEPLCAQRWMCAARLCAAQESRTQLLLQLRNGVTWVLRQLPTRNTLMYVTHLMTHRPPPPPLTTTTTRVPPPTCCRCCVGPGCVRGRAGCCGTTAGTDTHHTGQVRDSLLTAAAAGR